ncbi:MAG: dicarboxylate/amino acid:cation symporter [Alistipes sp.]|nr:dicarboxylate/amino acid:cation symporter [Candidatus Alistipes equi]
MKKIKIALIWRIVIACIAGILLGYILPLNIVRIFATFSSIFSKFISYMVPLIIVGLVTPAICRVGDKSGKLLILTILFAYTSTIAAGIFSFSITSNFIPALISNTAKPEVDEMVKEATPFFEIGMPPLMDVMSALVTAFLVGIILSTSKCENLKKIIFDFEWVVTEGIKRAIVPFLPLYIFCISLGMSYEGEAGPIMEVFSKIILLIFAMTLVWLLLLYIIAGCINKKNPIKLLIKMFPAYITALGTSSSAATIPVTLERAQMCGASSEIAAFTVPLCANIHMPGSIIKVTSCAVAVTFMQGGVIDMATFIQFIIMLSLTVVAAPGVPGGVIMAALGVLQSVLGFSAEQQGLMIALYILMDSFGTAANVTGDGAIALIVGKFNGK